MAVFSTHVLNAVDGRDAAGVGVAVYGLGGVGGDGERRLLVRGRSDGEGRMREEVAVGDFEGGEVCELVVGVGEYFAEAGVGVSSTLREAVVRFVIAETELQATYHIPLIISPYGYSVWCSQAQG